MRARRSFGAVAILAAALFLAAPAAASAETVASDSSEINEGGFRIRAGGVTPSRTVPYSVEPVSVYLRFASWARTRVAIRFYRVASPRPKLVRRIVTGRIAPDRWHRRRWDGRTARGRLAPPGLYRVMAGPAGGPFAPVDRVRLHGHRFPVDGRHGTRGYIGEFGAPRTGGRTHEGFDITARCGTPLVAVRSGIVIRKEFDPELDGHFVVLKGEAERRTYRYSHLRRPAPVTRGQKVRAGRRLGSVGQTGNAASTPCHLHFEVRARGRLLDPKPLLAAWSW